MKPTRCTSILNIRDPRCGAVILSQWTLQTADAQRAAAEAALAAMPAAPGLLCFSLFRGLDDFTLFLLSQWTDEPARDAYITVSSKPRAVVDEALPNIARDWRYPSSLYRSFIGDESTGLECLVVVRQPLRGNDHQIQRNWADTVIAALESQVEPAPGLVAASFFLSTDGTHVLNLGEWKSADAHRSWLSRERRGESSQWQAVLSHPGAVSGGDVRRYEFLGAVEPVESYVKK